MATNKQLVDGNQALGAQEQALNFMETSSFAKVISYAKNTQNVAAGSKPNEAVLEDVPIGQQPGPLHLEAVDVNGDTTAVIAAQLKAGKKVIFHDVAFVSGNEQMVLGFR